MTSPENGITVLGVDNVLFTIGDLDEAVRFYTTLGLPLAFRMDERGIALFRLGGEPAGLLVRRDDVSAGSGDGRPRLWLEVADARAVARTLREAGVAALADPFPVATGWTVEVADPWGNVVGFTDYTTMPERGRGA
ncbi:VOC family protein [Microbispora hainanensis]|uniref:VOC family protein n=1 Tax=Microbispora hainanensis TaxID=568844 RepID=A0ABZ1T0D9_9ACTN|nr:VOC family protein [Microbispora hainanensis]